MKSLEDRLAAVEAELRKEERGTRYGKSLLTIY